MGEEQQFSTRKQKPSSRKRVLLVSNVPILPANAGNCERVRTLVQALQEMGADVHLLVCGPDAGDRTAAKNLLAGRYTYYSHQFRVPAHPAWLKIVSSLTGGRIYYGSLRYLRKVDDIYDRQIDLLVRRIADEFEPDMVIVEYVFFSAALECFDGSVVKVVDSHDVLGNRLWRFWRNRCPVNAWTISPAEESRGLNRANVVLAIQDEEAEDFRTRVNCQVLTLGHRVVRKKLAAPANGDRKRVLFLGSGNHLNKRGVDRFIRYSLPIVRARYPGVILEIVGSICEFIEPGEGVVLSGLSNDLETTYRRADVVINPVDFGTGLAIKNLQAMGYGKPLVVLKYAARGLSSGEGKAFLKAQSHSELAKMLIRVLEDRELAEELSEGADAFVREWNERAGQALHKLLAAIPSETAHFGQIVEGSAQRA